MNVPVDDRVVVGVDGSAGGLAAIRLAAREAAVRHRPLHVVHARTRPPGRPRPARAEADRCVDEAVRLAARTVPAGSVPISAEVVDGPPATVLLAAGRDARLLVVGGHGHGGFSETAAGSVTLYVVTHATGPVLVARGCDHAHGPVVVGVDGAGTSAAAVRFAAEEADLRRTELLALHAWTDEDWTELNDNLPGNELWSNELGERAERRVLAEAMAGVAERHPDLLVRHEVRRDSARRLLRRCSLTAQLVVVGHRGRGGFAGLLLGSVSRHLAQHAGCPTAVVRPGGR